MSNISEDAIVIILIFDIILNLIVFLGLGYLILMHIYLGFKGKTTYELIQELRKRNEKKTIVPVDELEKAEDLENSFKTYYKTNRQSPNLKEEVNIRNKTYSENPDLEWSVISREHNKTYNVANRENGFDDFMSESIDIVPFSSHNSTQHYIHN